MIRAGFFETNRDGLGQRPRWRKPPFAAAGRELAPRGGSVRSRGMCWHIVLDSEEKLGENRTYKLLFWRYRMIPQSAPTSSFLKPQSSHLHIDGETCPWCEQEIPPERLEEISGKIAAREREQTHAITAKLEQQHALQLDELRKAKEADVAKVKEDAAAEAIRIRREATEAAEGLVRDKIADKDKAVADAQAKIAEAEGKLSKLSEQHELALNERLGSQREILEKAKDDAINAEKAKAFEETQGLSNKVNELQRALEKKTNEELGEGAEIDLFEALKKEFPNDRIERVAKGAPGADILHGVMHNGRECGTIIYDSKNHKMFRNEHVTKLLEDQLAAKAEHAILSTHKFPAGTRQLHMQDGVLLANPARVVSVVTLIRRHLLQAHTLRLSSAERESKTAALYAFITSERCTQLLSRIDAQADELLEQQVKERKWHRCGLEEGRRTRPLNSKGASRTVQRNQLHYRHGARRRSGPGRSER